MVLHLKVIGYYNHSNIGDEQYKETFTKIFKEYLKCEYKLEFIECDKICNYNFSKRDIIILGGGDVLNQYFLDKINKKFKKGEHLILAVSVGLPYIETLIKTNQLDIIDYIFLRTTVDLDLFKKYFFDNRIFYLPDLSYLLIEQSEQNNEGLYQIEEHKKQGKKIVTFCLSRHIYNKNYKQEYEKIIKCFSKLCSIFTTMNYHIVFLPFNTSLSNDHENDIIIHNDVLNNSFLCLNDVTFIDKQLKTNQVLDVLNNTDLCIAMRFHACLFSIYTHTPFLAIYTTRKIKNLVKEMEWEYVYELPKNDKDIPIDIDIEMITELLMDLQQEKMSIIHQLIHINEKVSNDMNNNIETFINCLTSKKKSQNVEMNNIDKLLNNTYNFIQDYAQKKGYDHFKDVTDIHLQQTIVNIVSYKLTNGRINSEYNYGLQEKMFNHKSEYNYKVEWRWIINNELQKDKSVELNNDLGFFNLKYIDQEDYSGSHRSGWQYVYKNLEKLHNNSSDLLLDLYIDRTFHWNLEINCLLGILPYRKKWIGFIHHTFDETFSNYNCHMLLNCPEFIESLKCCRGIFVLSQCLKDQFENEFKKRNLNTPIYVLMHPTEINVKKFSYKNFNNNKNKRLVHIGGWLRNVYSFYNLKLPQITKFYYGFFLGDKSIKPYGVKSEPIKKIALRGKNMNNYYPSENFLSNLELILKNDFDVNDFDVKDEEINSTQRFIDLDSETINNIIRLQYLRQYKRYPMQNISINNPMSFNNLQRLQDLRQRRERSIQIYSNCSTIPNCCYSNCSIGDGIVNNWNKHFYDDVCTKINSIEFIEYLDNDKYDILLSENIVFINLVDASAVNTVIECIVRATPIIVNKHPAVVELLGKNYPLYFNSDCFDYNGINTEINNILKSDKLIRRAHLYLKRKNLDCFSILVFITQFAKILKNID